MIINKIKVGDEILNNGISYIVEADEDGYLWGVSNNAEYEIEIDKKLSIIFDQVDKKVWILNEFKDLGDTISLDKPC